MKLWTSFKEIKEDCTDLVMTDRNDHCVDLEDDCEERKCPRIKKALGIREREEAHREREEAQCPTCGSIVAPHEIEQQSSFWRDFFITTTICVTITLIYVSLY